jgi:hypothetical protein
MLSYDKFKISVKNYFLIDSADRFVDTKSHQVALKVGFIYTYLKLPAGTRGSGTPLVRPLAIYLLIFTDSGAGNSSPT